MSLRRIIKYPCGAELHIYPDGKKHYVPSKKYKDKKKEYLSPKQFRGKPETEENCFRLLAAVFGYSLEKVSNPFKDQLAPVVRKRPKIWAD